MCQPCAEGFYGAMIRYNKLTYFGRPKILVVGDVGDERVVPLIQRCVCGIVFDRTWIWLLWR